MKTKMKTISDVHPFVIFWIGLLTGAVLVGLAFFYRFLTPDLYQSSLLRTYRYDYSKSLTLDKNSTLDGSITNIGDPSGLLVDPYAIGDPGGM